MSAAGVCLRSAAARDLPALARVWHASWHEGHAALDPEIAAGRPLSFFEDRVATAIGHTLVAEREGAIVGFAAWEGDGIGQCFVHPDATGTGVAALLLEAVEQVLAEKGHGLIWLHCREGNERARRFYEKHGWHVAKTVEDDVGTEAGRVPVAVWRMEKRLK